LLLLPGIAGMVLSKIIFANLSGSGKPQFATYSSALTFTLTILLDILLIPPYNIVGAAIASSIAYLLGSFMSVFWFSRQTRIRWDRIILPTRQDLADVWKQLTQLVYSLRTRYAARG
jgi:Na+-driven multidrug efflux pump